jgi:hypothetical protein
LAIWLPFGCGHVHVIGNGLDAFWWADLLPDLELPTPLECFFTVEDYVPDDMRIKKRQKRPGVPTETPLKHRPWVPVPGGGTPSNIGEGHFVEIELKAPDKELTEAATRPSPGRHHLALTCEDSV